MKKKIIILIIILLVVAGGIVYYITSKESTTTEETTYKDVSVSKMDLENTLTSSGEVTSETIEIELNTYRYFKTLYFEEGEYISKGTKILKYTNGTYYKAPYDLVLVGYSLPDEKKRITSKHYLQVKKVNDLEMSLSIDESEIDKVSVGQKVNITMNAFEDKIYEGEITFINQIGTYSSSGTKYSATLEFENDGDIKIGMGGNISIVLESSKDAIVVPIEAIQTKDNKKYVVVVKSDNTTEEVDVETGISNAAYVEIKSGLKEDETVRMIETTTTSTSSSRRFNRENFSEGNRPDMGNMPSNFTPTMNRN